MGERYDKLLSTYKLERSPPPPSKYKEKLEKLKDLIREYVHVSAKDHKSIIFSITALLRKTPH